MTQFEFVITGLSLLVAIMLGRVISTLSTLNAKTLDLKHLGWVLVLTFQLLLAWWLTWRYRELTFTARTYFAFLAPIVVLMYSAATLTPIGRKDKWSDYFESVRVRFFISYALFWVMLFLSQWVLLNQLRPSVVPFVLCVVGATTKHRIVQWTILALMAMVFVLVGVVFPEKM